MGLPFKLFSLQSLWFISSLVAVLCGIAHFVVALPAMFSPEYMNKMGRTIFVLYMNVFLAIAISYASTLFACIGNWWEQAKKSSSKWTMFFSFIFLSDSIHYIMFCVLFMTSAIDFLRVSGLLYS